MVANLGLSSEGVAAYVAGPLCSASSYAYAISALLRQLVIESCLPAAVSLEKLRLGLRKSLARGDYLRRKVDPRIDAFVAWVAT